MFTFYRDNRLQIDIPVVEHLWEDLTLSEQEELLHRWEQIRSTIPNRIIEIETLIMNKQFQLSNEENFDHSCDLNSQIAELASIINDLWLWYRKSLLITSK
ncbi:hypothetical protein [Guptibacillus algicola]|uniref:hypothetical protein n=1 Tax=Guptibacillus algicola TaxID=225844 RepID=UPI001CD5F31B|nr:hypothetical protein [Alkalihalobacillus algicola]MCA0986354.1 hypothetical protein [Alkalihalobacillus algicola]